MVLLCLCYPLWQTAFRGSPVLLLSAASHSLPRDCAFLPPAPPKEAERISPSFTLGWPCDLFGSTG